MPSGRPSIGADFHARVEEFLKEHPELGYQNTSELIKELLRNWMREQTEGDPLTGTPPATAAADARPDGWRRAERGRPLPPTSY